ncbi:MAG: right-handed parallel beta-helix repeat-containing protein [Sagittula sp.]|uniref:right-handed parallel beta-helix repeat-containing protein n=1 Tax=Sagittula sp. TaxID=2038081 RepID=UPI004058C1E4
MPQIARRAAALWLLLAATAVPAQEGPAAFDPADFGRIVIQPRQSAGGPVLEQAFGNYQNEPVIGYGAASPVVRLGRPVGRLDMKFRDGRTGFCTAFLVGGGHILTNHHCVPGMDGDPAGADSGLEAAQLVLGYVDPGNVEQVELFEVAPEIVETSRALDYSVLTVRGAPEDRYGIMELADADPESGEFLWIIGHPQGQAQHISREGCAAATPAVSREGKLMHSCDTLGGNSGSPVMRLTDKRVVGLHHAGDSRSGYNMAIPMRAILAASTVLRAADGTGTPQPPAAPDGAQCSTLWQEARRVGCAGYEAYLDACGGHVFAGMARQQAARECTQAAPARTPEAPGALVVDAAGGGGYTDLAQALRAASDGAVIELYPGTYRGGIKVSRPLSIVGRGAPGEVVLLAEGGPAVVWTATGGGMDGITIRHRDSASAAVEVTRGALTLERTTIDSDGLAAVRLRDDRGSVLRRNKVLAGAARGILVEGGAPVIEDNEVRGASLAGFEAGRDARPEVRGNAFLDGRGSGILVTAGGGGVYEDNRIEGNGLAGIELVASARPDVRGNVIRGGGQSGIMVTEGATARIEGNRISGTAMAGVEIREGAAPEVFGNDIRDGAQSGIYVHSGGGGVLQDNHLDGNAFHGLSVKGRGRLIVRGNTFRGNVHAAIRIREGGGGTYEANDLAGNAGGGFVIEPDAGTVLRQGNRE